MGMITIQYGDDSHVWQDGDVVNEISSSMALSITTALSQLLTLRVFETQAEAVAAREKLLEKIAYGLGNGTIVIDIDDF